MSDKLLYLHVILQLRDRREIMGAHGSSRELTGAFGDSRKAQYTQVCTIGGSRGTSMYNWAPGGSRELPEELPGATKTVYWYFDLFSFPEICKNYQFSHLKYFKGQVMCNRDDVSNTTTDCLTIDKTK